mgnify:CR=1 FL=1
MNRSIKTTSPQQTQEIARSLAEKVKAPAIICLYGDLGAGKTTFTKGFASHYGLNEKDIKSPTYTFVREYKLGSSKLFHFDFYRIEAIDELIQHDLEEIFSRKDAVILIEWPERIQEILPAQRTEVRLTHESEQERGIEITPPEQP